MTNSGVRTGATACGCTGKSWQDTGDEMANLATITQSEFGTTPDDVATQLFTLTNPNGIEVSASTYGATIVSLRTPDRDGRCADIVLGHASLDGYLDASPYLGSMVGRYSNRIARGRFEIDGQTYQLTINDGSHHLHGGTRGFDKVVWDAQTLETEHAVSVTFHYTSPAGDEGYPGALDAHVTYTLTNANELRVDCAATTDAPTHVNLSQHSYFNLTGGESDVLDHLLEIPASRFTPVDPTLIPMGGLARVDGTPFDFRTPAAIGARIDRDDEQLRHGRGYDHNFVLDRDTDGLAVAARVKEQKSGRTLVITTTEPGLQFYSGNVLDGTITGKAGRVYGRRSGFCLETQHFPDSPNRPDFPSTILRPGDVYRSTTVFTFGVSP